MLKRNKVKRALTEQVRQKSCYDTDNTRASFRHRTILSLSLYITHSNRTSTSTSVSSSAWVANSSGHCRLDPVNVYRKTQAGSTQLKCCPPSSISISWGTSIEISSRKVSYSDLEAVCSFQTSSSISQDTSCCQTLICRSSRVSRAERRP